MRNLDEDFAYETLRQRKLDEFDSLTQQLAAKDAEISEIQQDLQTTVDALGHANREIEQLTIGLENCRLFAARNRKEDWALLILIFCAESGVVGSVTR